jgi:hypothetical protein
MVDLTKVAAHYAISSLFEEYSEDNEVFCYTVTNQDYRTSECGKSRMVTGLARVASEVTGESALLTYGVFHFGGHVINAGVREFRGDEAYQNLVQELAGTCTTGDFTEVVRLLDKHFGGSTYSLKSLFRDEQRKVLGYILESTMSEIETAYRQLYEHHYPPMRFLAELGGPVPRAFHSAAELIINIDLHRAVAGESIDAEAVRSMVATARTWQVELDGDGVGYDFKTNLENMMTALSAEPEDIERMKNVLDAATLARSLPFPVDLWRVQNIYWEMLQNTYPALKERADRNEGPAVAWVTVFKELGKKLSIRVA